MKQLLSLFLFLLPCLAWAQYPSNGNQKITLGEQTTADGLIYRGVLGDTALITPLSDTSAYIILDTVNHRFYNYNRATNVWSVAGGGTSVTTFSGGTTGLTPNTATSGAVTLGGTLAVANGGTGATSFSPNNYLIRTNSSGNFDTSLVYEAGGRVGIGTASPLTNLDLGASGENNIILRNTGNAYNLGYISNSGGNIEIGFSGSNVSLNRATGGGSVSFNTAGQIITKQNLDVTGSGGRFTGQSTRGDVAAIHMEQTTTGADGGFIDFRTSPNGSTTPSSKVRIAADGNVGIGTASPTQVLHVVGNARITAVGAGTFSNNLNITSDGTLTTATSDIKFKYNIRPLNYGLETLLQLKPVNFQWIEGEEEDLGFIAQDVAEIIPEAVNTNWNSDLLFRYESLIPILTKAIQEQQTLIKALEQRIINLENK